MPQSCAEEISGLWSLAPGLLFTTEDLEKEQKRGNGDTESKHEWAMGRGADAGTRRNWDARGRMGEGGDLGLGTWDMELQTRGRGERLRRRSKTKTKFKAITTEITEDTERRKGKG